MQTFDTRPLSFRVWNYNYIAKHRTNTRDKIVDNTNPERDRSFETEKAPTFFPNGTENSEAATVNLQDRTVKPDV